jgi:hypothetical protein
MIAASANHSATTAASANDNNDDNNKANEQSLQVGTDADERGQ